MRKCFDCGTNTNEKKCPNCGGEDIRSLADYYDEEYEDE